MNIYLKSQNNIIKKAFIFSMFVFVFFAGAAYVKASGNVTITFPERKVLAAPEVATITINDEFGRIFYIPYIQTSPDMIVSASATIPVGGGVKFVLNQGLSGEQTQFDMEAPFSVQFSNLPKAEYTVDVYIVDSSEAVQEGAGHDRATNIGIGDIITAIGDSITEGHRGKDYGKIPITNWLNATSSSVSIDKRNFPQIGPYSKIYRASFATELNDDLYAVYGYPVFVMNEGWGGKTTGGYVSLMSRTVWKNRQKALKPNKWIIHLGVNDGIYWVRPAVLQRNLQTIINILVSEYGADSKNIWLAKPMYPRKTEKYLPAIEALIKDNNLSAGPDFGAFYKIHPELTLGGANIHPNVAGMTEMARLWFLAITNQGNFSAFQNMNDSGFVSKTDESPEQSLSYENGALQFADQDFDPASIIGLTITSGFGLGQYLRKLIKFLFKKS